MCELAAEEVTEDLGISVWVGWETGSAIDTILVQDAQTAKVLIARIVVVCEGEGVVAV